MSLASLPFVSRLLTPRREGARSPVPAPAVARASAGEPVAAAPVERLAWLLSRADRVCVLTGAGLSAPSGLRTYRGEGGLWDEQEPVRYREFLTDPAARMRQWRRSLADARAFAAAEPNPGHLALARLALRPGSAVVTQNVDGLHRRSGIRAEALIELHGRGDEAVCLGCRGRFPMTGLAAAIEAGEDPRCPRDGDLLKPAVVMFGERPLASDLARAEELARACDLFLVVGSTLAVTPAGFLPVDARHSGARVAVVNRGAVRRDLPGALLVEGDAAVILPAAVPG